MITRITALISSSFNSRPHKEVDQTGSPLSNACDLSIHDLTRRSTSSPRPPSFITAFQFTTSQGGRRYSIIIRTPIIAFQFTTSQGGRRTYSGNSSAIKPFNSRPHKEVDGTRVLPNFVVATFNSRPHKEVD